MSLRCIVCSQNCARYTCPRCNCHYCSVKCYKDHSVSCTESFFRSSTIQELKSLKASDEEQGRMMEVLSRLHLSDKEESIYENFSNEDQEDKEEEVATNVLKKLQIKKGSKPEDFTSEEQMYIRHLISSGKLSSYIEPWVPWWTLPEAKDINLGTDGTGLIQEKNVSTDLEPSGAEILSPFPRLPSDPIPTLQSLTSVDPSPLLIIHLADILYGYCFTLKLYNGDWGGDALGATEALLSISAVTGQSFVLESLDEVLSGCLSRVCSPEWRDRGGKEYAIGLVEDVANLLKLGTTGVILALTELQRMVTVGGKEMKESSKVLKNDVAKQQKNKLKGINKKLQYFLSWAFSQEDQVFLSFGSLVETHRNKLRNENTSVASYSPGQRRNPLIVEQ